MDPAHADVARWEFRTFGEGFPDVERLVLSRPHEERDSHETYLVRPGSTTNVKIRAGLLDVKRLERVDHGLEQWRPVLKAAFPIEAPVIARLFGYWALEAPALARATYTREQLLDEVITPVPELRTVDVVKARRGTTIGGCSVEVARLSVAGRPVQTAAVESGDPEQVRRTLHALGLSAHANVNYVNALSSLLDARRP